MAVHFSEIGYTDAPPNFFEVAAPAGTDMSGYSIAIYGASGVLQTTMTFGTPDATMFGQDVYSFDESSPGYAEYGASEALALVDGDGNVVQFVSFEGKTVTPGSGPAAGVTSEDLGFLESGETFETRDGGATYSAQSAPNQGTVPCFARGTLIATPEGPRPVEALRPGDRVTTVDRGAQPVVWAWSGPQMLAAVAADARPILIAAGALGPGRPARDLVVSPQHRVLVGGLGQMMALFAGERLVAAKALTALPGVRFMRGRRAVDWVHLAFARHELILAEGCIAESLLLRRMVWAGLNAADRRALRTLFGCIPAGSDCANGPPARVILRVAEAQGILRRAKGGVRDAGPERMAG
ncbi:Hint domain-containing protein [Jannaschia ovalis]|uniref:Hint domain-containing protein n=1 Tax=Jannaschia ovalis TaxID=3038773 RepID=A0ABY8LEN2_9RHOB|nr:Hint domain-containing protein [Jannaschia sp. GRR-S6-38]WGH78858.1 Hint domain-containing protein [Jannaschia sp. GRR-S6-38]